MYSRRKEMWQLRCQTCGTTFLMDRKRNFQIREGWRVYYYCSKECKEAKGRLGVFDPMKYQTEAERQAAMSEVVARVIRRRK